MSNNESGGLKKSCNMNVEYAIFDYSVTIDRLHSVYFLEYLQCFLGTPLPTELL